MRPSGSVPAAGALGQVPPGPDSSRGSPWFCHRRRKEKCLALGLCPVSFHPRRTDQGRGWTGSRGASCRLLCPLPAPWQGSALPLCPRRAPLRELKPYTSGCLASRPGANTSPFSLPFLPRAAGASLAEACSAWPRGRGRFRPGVFCHGPVLLLTGRAWSHAGSCHTRERVPTSRSLVLSPVRSGASPGAGCRSGLPGHLPGLGPRPPCPPAGSCLPSIQRALCLPCLNLGPGPGAPPLTQPLQTD